MVSRQTGVTLVETIIFIVIVSIALVSLLIVFNQSVVNSVDPLVRVKALERAQAVLDLVKSRKYDENTPTGGVPACGSSAGVACAGISPDTDYDDVGDFNGYSDVIDPQFPASVVVVEAGSELGLVNSQARRITVSVAMPDGNSVTLSGYKVNY